MAEYTQNYNLKKPGVEDFVNVEDLNENFDVLDGEINRLGEEVESVSSQLSEKAKQSALVQLSNPNLLNDGNFQLLSNTIVNVDGSKNITGNWYANNSITTGISISKNYDFGGMSVTWLKQCIGDINYVNYIEKSKLIGENITLSIKIDGSIYKYSTCFTTINNFIWIDMNTKNISTSSGSNANNTILLRHADAPVGTVHIIEWVKLELGSLATPFISKSLVQEYVDGNNLSNPNLLINGDFQVWQRGTSFDKTLTRNKYTADRWWCNADATIVPDITVLKLARGIRFATTVATANASSVANMSQKVETTPFEPFVGKTATFSVKILAMIGSNEKQIRVMSYYASTTVATLLIPAGSPAGVYSLTFTIPSTITNYLEFAIDIKNKVVGSDYIEIDWAKVEIGSVATPFVPRLYAEELLMCQRYYEKCTHIYRAIAGTNTPTRLTPSIAYKVTKRVTPTVTLYGGTNGVNPNKIIDPAGGELLSYQSYSSSESGFGAIDVSSNTVAGRVFEFSWIADAEI